MTEIHYAFVNSIIRVLAVDDEPPRVTHPEKGVGPRRRLRVLGLARAGPAIFA